jgi:hypothetical protein
MALPTISLTNAFAALSVIKVLVSIAAGLRLTQDR